MIIAYFPLVICLIGLLMYMLLGGPTNAHTKAAEIGRIMFAAGLLVTLLTMASKVIKLT